MDRKGFIIDNAKVLDNGKRFRIGVDVISSGFHCGVWGSTGWLRCWLSIFVCVLADVYPPLLVYECLQMSQILSTFTIEIAYK